MEIGLFGELSKLAPKVKRFFFSFLSIGTAFIFWHRHGWHALYTSTYISDVHLHNILSLPLFLLDSQFKCIL